ncbi:unnamed protein product [Nezara viridula]|uniref:Uncharacterized protein n=1 Tax=Nezara viridula TaxID=85310 RepID=A0A9P0HLC2_NEZVI|nr:unnamed protein product [Nezara viridula]
MATGTIYIFQSLERKCAIKKIQSICQQFLRTVNRYNPRSVAIAISRSAEAIVFKAAIADIIHGSQVLPEELVNEKSFCVRAVC